MSRVNLMSAPRRQRQRARRRARAWGAVCAAYALILAAGVAGATTMEGESAAIRRDLLDGETRAQARQRELEALTQRLAAAQRAHEAAVAVGHHADWSILLGLLGSKVDDNVVLERVSVSPQRVQARRANTEPADPEAYDVELMGVARSQRAVSAFVLDLEGTGLFASVTLVSTRARPGQAGELVAFQISARLAPSVAAAGAGGAR
jgi:Tfp pilus assembly protein PilN